MSRVLWIGVGAVAGVLVVRRGRRVVRQYTPAGVSDSLASVAQGLRELAAAVREGMDEREGELRYALGLDTQTLPEGQRPDGDGIRTLLDDPAGPRAR